MEYNEPNKNVDYEAETELQMWFRIAKETYGDDLTTKVIGSGEYQNGYEYAKEIVAIKNGIVMATYEFELPLKELEYGKQIAA